MCPVFLVLCCMRNRALIRPVKFMAPALCTRGARATKTAVLGLRAARERGLSRRRGTRGLALVCPQHWEGGTKGTACSGARYSSIARSGLRSSL